MESSEPVESSGRSSPLSTQEKYKFIGLIALIFIVSFGHMYVIKDMTQLVGGLPAWVWIQVVIIAILGFVGWWAIWILLRDAEGGGG